MCSDKATPTVDELFEALKRTSLPTVLVEGKDDIIFYRKVEEALRDFGVDMLPAGNKGAVLDLQKKLAAHPISAPMIFVVDNDLWVHARPVDPDEIEGIITTEGYSIENDLFSDGDLESLLDEDEVQRFRVNLEKFSRWYALAVSRHLSGKDSTFRTHPGKLLDDIPFYASAINLDPDEEYPEELYNEIISSYSRLLRGKSLFALLLRELSAHRRKVKFSAKQLMAFGASRKGANFERLHTQIREALQAFTAKREAPTG